METDQHSQPEIKGYMASRSAPSELLITLLVVQRLRLAPKNGRQVQLKKTPYCSVVCFLSLSAAYNTTNASIFIKAGLRRWNRYNRK